MNPKDIINKNVDRSMLKFISEKINTKHIPKKWYQNIYLKSSYWNKVRRSILFDCNYKCEKCNKTDKLHCHHLCYDNLGQELREDILAVCKDCHLEFHPQHKVKLKKIKKSRKRKKIFKKSVTRRIQKPDNLINRSKLKNICKINCGNNTCKYISLSRNGFICLKNTLLKNKIDSLVNDNKMVALNNDCKGEYR